MVTTTTTTTTTTTIQQSMNIIIKNPIVHEKKECFSNDYRPLPTVLTGKIKIYAIFFLLYH